MRRALSASRRSPWLSALLLSVAPMALAAGAAAQDAPPSPSREQPVMLSARELGYDRKQAKVVAVGDVEVVQGDYIVLADRLTYDQNSGQVHATGNVSVRQPNGDVYFADDVKLKDDLKAGVVQDFRARMQDNSLFAAREARKVNEDVTELDNAVYSPCKICGDSSPLWQLKAREVTVDEKKQEVVYNNAHLEVKGVPVAWTPYFEHATPGAEAKPGLLTPQYGSDSNLGTTLSVPVYYPFSSNIDLTLFPTYYTKEGAALGTQFRHLTESGYYEVKGSLTNPDRRDNTTGDRLDGNELRGHIDAFGNFALDKKWGYGFQLQRATDDTYLRRYDISDADTLTTRAYLEGIEGREYASIQSLAFQGLTLEDDPDRTPYILPLGDYAFESNPGWAGSRYSVSASTLLLARDLGPESRRLSVTGAYELPYVTGNGHIIEQVVSLRTDGYSVQDVPTTSGTAPDTFDGETARAIPQYALNWRYPLINEYAPGQTVLIEPLASFIISPNGSNKDLIPNEDSQVLEFTDTNLFSMNRFPGYDLVETGPRFNYGAKGQWQFRSDRYVNFLLGQNYQVNDDNPFPFTNDLDDYFSDYVGRIALDWSNWFTASYRFRLDRKQFEPRRNEVNTSFNFDPVMLYVDYLELNDDPFLSDREEIFTTGALRLTDYWTLLAGTRRDLDENEMLGANAGVQYSDECITVLTQLARDLIRDRDVEPSTSFLVRVALKNLN